MQQAICSDIQAALTALQSPKATSGLVVDTMLALKSFSVFNGVRLLWVLGHSNVAGNEIIDQLAKTAANTSFVDHEPILGITMSNLNTEVYSWAKKELCKEWCATSIGRQANFFIHGHDNNLTRFAMGLNRPDLRILVDLLTGHYNTQ